MTEQETKLLPCPFCGGKARWCGDDPKEPHDCDQIVCTECEMQFNSYHETVKAGDTLEKARVAMSKLWNNRSLTAHMKWVEQTEDDFLGATKAIMEKKS